MGKHLLASSCFKALQKRRDLSWALKPECIFTNGERVKGHLRGGGSMEKRRTICVWGSVLPDGRV